VPAERQRPGTPGLSTTSRSTSRPCARARSSRLADPRRLYGRAAQRGADVPAVRRTGQARRGQRLASYHLDHVLEILARGILILRCGASASLRERSYGRPLGIWPALFGSGFELLTALLGGATYTGNWSYELNGFGLLFAAPHVRWRWRPRSSSRVTACADTRLTPKWLLKSAVLSAALALLHPFHEPCCWAR